MSKFGKHVKLPRQSILDVADSLELERNTSARSVDSSALRSDTPLTRVWKSTDCHLYRGDVVLFVYLYFRFVAQQRQLGKKLRLK